ncbi:unnamed protein product [Pleuronectes platessa]|uniref:Uncharacterized protein n=1 Tax=Pleuronectes platessa TaxID=8262 RepID=A0A9N7VD42_PLEPL|nr:unnamed protein product [Pleuronectes platessa]
MHREENQRINWKQERKERRGGFIERKSKITTGNKRERKGEERRMQGELKQRNNWKQERKEGRGGCMGSRSRGAIGNERKRESGKEDGCGEEAKIGIERRKEKKRKN